MNHLEEINAATPAMLQALQDVFSALRDEPAFKDFATTEDGRSIQPIAIVRATISAATEGVQL